MRRRYTPPSPQALRELRENLGLTQAEMAAYAALSCGQQWRKYTGGARPHKMSYWMLYHLAARAVLSPEQHAAVLAEMQAIGAGLEGEGA